MLFPEKLKLKILKAGDHGRRILCFTTLSDEDSYQEQYSFVLSFPSLRRNKSLINFKEISYEYLLQTVINSRQTMAHSRMQSKH